MTIEAYTANDEEILIPLLSKGLDNHFDNRTPISHELDFCPHVHLTYVNQEWNPSKIVFPNSKTNDDIQLQQVTMCSVLSTSMMFTIFILKFRNYHAITLLLLKVNLLSFPKKDTDS